MFKVRNLNLLDPSLTNFTFIFSPQSILKELRQLGGVLSYSWSRNEACSLIEQWTFLWTLWILMIAQIKNYLQFKLKNVILLHWIICWTFCWLSWLLWKQSCSSNVFQWKKVVTFLVDCLENSLVCFLPLLLNWTMWLLFIVPPNDTRALYV